MRNTFTQDLPPISGFIPTPCAVIDLGDTEAAFKAWDSAWAALHDSPEDKRALALAEKS